MKKEELQLLKNLFPANPSIMGRESFLNAVVMVLFFECEGELYLVFEKRSERVRQGGEICFPGGKIEADDESPENTALRETEEELGLPAEKINVLGRLDTQYAPIGALVEAVVGFADIKSIDELNPNQDEISYIFSVPFRYFVENKPEKYSVLLKAHSYFFDESGTKVDLLPSKDLGLPERYHEPWGTTAGIMR